MEIKVEKELQRVGSSLGPNENEILSRVEKSRSPEGVPDLDALYELCMYYKDNQKFKEAIQYLLEGVEHDKNWNDRAFLNTITEVFTSLDSKDVLL